MADITLTNTATASGSYNNTPTAMDSTAVTTLLVDGLSITKTADKRVWVTGVLTYTITVKNEADYPYENPVVTDTLDPALVTLVDDSVKIDGVATTDYTINPATGLLTVDLPDIAVDDSAVITFQVQKV